MDRYSFPVRILHSLLHAGLSRRTDISSTRIDLVEFKRRYDATFVNEFLPEGEGMRYTLTASVRLKWPYWLAAPFVKPLVLARMRRYVVEPLKAAAESEH